MAMSALIATAESAQDIAAALDKFLNPVSDDSTEITALMSECYAISSALRELNTCRGDLRVNWRYPQVDQDVRLTLQSLEYTFNDVRRLFGGLGSTVHPSQSAAYRAVWEDIKFHFRNESRNTFCQRLEYYRRFLLILAAFIQGLVVPNLTMRL